MILSFTIPYRGPQGAGIARLGLIIELLALSTTTTVSTTLEPLGLIIELLALKTTRTARIIIIALIMVLLGPEIGLAHVRGLCVAVVPLTF